jgi:hypothetical protein
MPEKEVELTSKQIGIFAGYVSPIDSLPECPFPLYDKDKLRHKERDEWLSGWYKGQRLQKKHKAELETLVKWVPDEEA